MLYAQVVLGLPVEGPFDYIVPLHLAKKINEGSRVWVPFRMRRMLGYVVKLKTQTKIKNLKNILEVIDDIPILDKGMLLLTKELSDYYCCAWGEAIETALPDALRRGRRLPNLDMHQGQLKRKETPSREIPYYKDNPEVILIHHLKGKARWNIYLKHIREALELGGSVIVLLPDVNSVLKAKEIITTHLGILPGFLYRKQPKEWEEWLKIKEGKIKIVVGTRSGIFAPLSNLGLVIIDEEENSAYKQDQVPHYHAREVAFMRINIQKAKLILGSASPSLESFYKAKNCKIKYLEFTTKKDFPEIKIIDMKRLPLVDRKPNIIFSKYLQDSVASTISAKGKILIFANRKGFATFASCRYCGVILKCQRCNINLVYHFKDNILKCHYCNFKIKPPKICPNCNSSYIRYSGVGTEKIESELNRLFPQAKIKRLDKPDVLNFKDANIFISTKSIIGQTKCNFDLTCVLSIDNSLNRIDFRASEKTFGLLTGLLELTQQRLIIQTSLPNHHCFQALVNKDINIFYEQELKQREELMFPPYQHLGLVKLRSEKEERVKLISQALFEKLKKHRKNKRIKIVSVNPTQPSKLRGKFWWQILIKSDSAKRISKFLKMYLKDFSHSGIIVTVDID